MSPARFTSDPPTRLTSDPRWSSSLRPPLGLQPAVRLEDANNDDRAVADLLDAVHLGNASRAKKAAKELSKVGIGVDEAVAAAAVGVTGAKRRGPLHVAAANGNAEICRFLIKTCKVDVDATDSDGATPLIFAIQGLGSIIIARLLLKNGANPNKADNSGVAPLHIAAERGLFEVAELLLSSGAVVDLICENHGAPLHIAAQNGHAKMLELLLEHKSDYNARSPATALVIAAGKGLPDCIKCLLKVGADANIHDEDGKLPVQIAACQGCKKCVEILRPLTTSFAKYATWSIDEIIQHEKTASSEPQLQVSDLDDKENAVFDDNINKVMQPLQSKSYSEKGKALTTVEENGGGIETLMSGLNLGLEDPSNKASRPLPSVHGIIQHEKTASSEAQVSTIQVDDMGMEEFVQGRCNGSFAKLFHLFCGIDVVGSKTRGFKILCQAYRYVIDMIRHNKKSWGGKFAACHLRFTAGKFRIDLAPLLPATAENTWADLNGIATCMVAYFVLGSKRCIYVRHLFDLCEKLHKGLARGMNEPGANDRYLKFIYNHPCFGFSIERGDLIKGIGMALKHSSTDDINVIVSCLSIASGPPSERGDWRDDVTEVAVLQDVLFANIKDASLGKESTYFRPIPKDNFIFCRHALEHGAESTLIKTGGNNHQEFCPTCKRALRNKHQENLVSKSASVPGSSLQYVVKRIPTETSSSDTRVQTQLLQRPEELELLVGEVFDRFISDSICEIWLEPMLDNSPFVQVRLEVFTRSIRQELNAEGEEKDEDEGQNGISSPGLQGPSSAQDNGGS